MCKPTRINWTNFVKVRDDEKHNIVGAKCRVCGRILTVVTEKRLESHRQYCQDQGKAYDLERNFPGDNEDDAELDELQEAGRNEDEMEMKEILDKYLAKFFFSGGIAFRQVENKYLRRFVRKIQEFNVHYVPPSRITLGGNVLQKVHSEIVQRKKKFLRNTDGVLLVDGWRNKSINKKLLVFSVRNVNIDQTFLTFSDISNISEYSVNLAKEINAAIKYAKKKYDCNIYSVVSDNDNKIVKGIELSTTNDGQDLIQSTCSSHSGNLLIKSFVDEQLTVWLREIVTTFKDTKLEGELLSKGGTKLRNYPDTRFCYFRNTCESIVKNLHLLRELCNNANNVIDGNVKNRLLERDFEDVLTKTILNMDPICQLINQCQNPKTNIADATELWLNLRLPNNDYDNLISHRITKALYPVNYAANLLHPKYNGKSLNDDQQELAHIFLRDYLSEEAMQEFLVYVEVRESKFNEYGQNCKDPIDYWKIVGLRFPDLAKYAVRLLLIPGGTALLESLFSQWTYVHNIYRNKLKNKKSDELIDIYYSLKSDYFDDDIIEELLLTNENGEV